MTRGGYGLHDLLRSMGGDTRNLKLAAAIGEVVDSKDPERLGRVRLKFPWDWQGAYTAAWAMPVYPLNGDLMTDVPRPGEFLLCLFLDGQPTEPFYLGRTRGKPSKKDAEALSYEDADEALHVAVAEAVDEGFRKVLSYLKSHTHPVIVRAEGTAMTVQGPAPVVPKPTRHDTLAPNQAVPKIRKVGARRVRLHKKNDP